MRPGGGQSKGAAYEREVCARLSLWVSGGKQQDIFWRSAMSGGRANLQQRRKKAGEFSAQAGDIVATHWDGHFFLSKFCMDTKHWADFEIDAPAFGKKDGAFVVAWEKLCEEAARFGKWPMLVGKENRHGEFAAVSVAGLAWLRGAVRARPHVRLLSSPIDLMTPAYFVSFEDILTLDFALLVAADKRRTARVPILD